MFSRKLFSSSFAPTKGLLLHSRSPAARASSIGAAEALKGHVRTASKQTLQFKPCDCIMSTWCPVLVSVLNNAIQAGRSTSTAWRLFDVLFMCRELVK